MSALARVYAITGDAAAREKVLRLNRLWAQALTADVFVENRFPAYTYDKIVLGLLDSHKLAGDPQAWDSGEDDERRAAASAGTCGGAGHGLEDG